MRLFFAAMIALAALISPAMAAEKAPLEVTGARTISIDEGAEMFDEGVLFVDVRKASDYDAGRVPGAVNLYARDMTEDMLIAEVGKDDKLVFYCNGQTCGLSAAACEKAVQWGFTNVHYMRDGFPMWESAGLPVE